MTLKGDISVEKTPTAISAEQVVLGSILSGNLRVGGCVVAPGDFYRNDHRLIMAAIVAVTKDCEPVTLNSVCRYISDSGKAEEVGGDAYLRELCGYSRGGRELLAASMRAVVLAAVHRSLVLAGDAMATSAIDQQNPLDIISSLMFSLSSIIHRIE